MTGLNITDKSFNGLLGVPVPATVDGLADIWKGSGEVLDDSFQSIPDKSET